MKVCRRDSYTGVEICEFPQVKRRIKKMAKEQRHDLQFKTVSLYRLCEQSGRPECFWSVRNRIVRHLDEAGITEAAAGLFVDAHHLPDIRLSDTGLNCFREMLLSYFDPALINALYAYLHYYNEDERRLYILMQSESSETLKSWLRYYESPGPNDDHELFFSGAEKIKRELQRRKASGRIQDRMP